MATWRLESSNDFALQKVLKVRLLPKDYEN